MLCGRRSNVKQLMKQRINCGVYGLFVEKQFELNYKQARNKNKLKKRSLI